MRTASVLTSVSSALSLYVALSTGLLAQRRPTDAAADVDARVVDAHAVRVQKSLETLFAWRSSREVERASIRLGSSGETAVPGLSLLLQDPRLHVRTVVYRILEELGDHAKGSVPALVKRLRSDDLWERTRAAQLALTFEPDCDAAMFVLAEVDNMEYRRRAAVELPTSLDPVAVRKLMKLFDDDFGQVRNTAFTSIGRMGPRATPAIPKLIRKLTGKHASDLDIEDIPGAIHKDGAQLAGADRALFELGELAVDKLLERHGKAKGAALQFRVLNLLGNLRKLAELRRAIRISLVATDAKLREIAYRCLENLDVDDGAELTVLVTSAARYGDAESMPRILGYMKRIKVDSPALVFRVFRNATVAERTVVLDALARTPLDEDSAGLDGWYDTYLMAARDETAAIRQRLVVSLCHRVDRAKEIQDNRKVALLRSLLPVVVALARTDTDLGAFEARIGRAATDSDPAVRAASSTLQKALSRTRDVRHRSGSRKE